MVLHRRNTKSMAQAQNKPNEISSSNKQRRSSFSRRISFTQTKESFESQNFDGKISKEKKSSADRKKSITSRFFQHINVSLQKSKDEIKKKSLEEKVIKRSSESEESYATSAMSSIDSENNVVPNEVNFLGDEEMKKDIEILMEKVRHESIEKHNQNKSVPYSRKSRRKSECLPLRKEDKSRYKENYQILSKQVPIRCPRSEVDTQVLRDRNLSRRDMIQGTTDYSRVLKSDPLPLRRTNSVKSVLRSESIKSIIIDLKTETLEEQEELSNAHEQKVLEKKKNNDHMLHLLIS